MFSISTKNWSFYVNTCHPRNPFLFCFRCDGSNSYPLTNKKVHCKHYKTKNSCYLHQNILQQKGILSQTVQLSHVVSSRKKIVKFQNPSCDDEEKLENKATSYQVANAKGEKSAVKKKHLQSAMMDTLRCYTL